MSSSIVHVRDVKPRFGPFKNWERRRHSKGVHWFIELFAEALGVFFYVYAGVGATAAFIVATLASEPTVGSLFTVGMAYAFGVLFAVLICSATSGGHFNPCVTIAFTLFRGFPAKKVPGYIAAQIFGGYIASLLVYAQWRDNIVTLEHALQLKGVLGAIQFTPQGPAGIIALYAPAGAHLGRVFLNEFVTDTFLGIVIWACLDPSNILIPPPAGPWLIAFAYAVAIWGFAPNGLAANSARDVGGRLAALTIWGKEASGGTYAALAALTNIPAMLLGVVIYETFLTDSDRVVGSGHLEYMLAHKNHLRSPDRDARHHVRDDVSAGTTDDKRSIKNAERV